MTPASDKSHAARVGSTALDLLPGCGLHRLEAASWEDVLRALAEQVVAHGHARPSLASAVLERERRFPTGLPTPVPSAIPHTDAEHVLQAGLAVATLGAPVEFGVMGGTGETLPAEVVVLLCVTDPGSQVDGLQQVLRALGTGAAVGELLAHPDPATFESAVRSWLHAASR